MKFENQLEKNENKIVENLIYEIRGMQVMLDSDVAFFFKVETGKLNQQVKRNQSRFPDDFCFKLNSKEFKSLKSQNVTSNVERGRKTKLSSNELLIGS